MKKVFNAMAVILTLSVVSVWAQGPVKPAPDGTLYAPGKGGTVLAKGCTTEAVDGGLKVVFNLSQKWPKAYMSGPFDLSGYTAIEIQLTNIGTIPSKISVRADNPGPVSDRPWNMGVAYDPIEPGETKTLRIDFGYNNFRSQVESYPLDPSNISQIMVSMGRPSVEGITFRLDYIKAVK